MCIHQNLHLLDLFQSFSLSFGSLFSRIFLPNPFLRRLWSIVSSLRSATSRVLHGAPQTFFSLLKTKLFGKKRSKMKRLSSTSRPLQRGECVAARTTSSHLILATLLYRLQRLSCPQCSSAWEDSHMPPFQSDEPRQYCINRLPVNSRSRSVPHPSLLSHIEQIDSMKAWHPLSRSYAKVLIAPFPTIPSGCALLAVAVLLVVVDATTNTPSLTRWKRSTTLSSSSAPLRCGVILAMHGWAKPKWAGIKLRFFSSFPASLTFV